MNTIQIIRIIMWEERTWITFGLSPSFKGNWHFYSFLDIKFFRLFFFFFFLLGMIMKIPVYSKEINGSKKFFYFELWFPEAISLSFVFLGLSLGSSFLFLFFGPLYNVFWKKIRNWKKETKKFLYNFVIVSKNKKIKKKNKEYEWLKNS